MADRGPTVINTGSRGNGAWAVAIVLALVVIGALLMFTGVIDIGGGRGAGADVNVNVPAVEAPSSKTPASADTPAAAPATTSQ
ncbi:MULTISPECIES: hypothetical protein [unclassified Rhizobium]|uniref:hypothetical protein n=1 Tax=unclassified Rhizobium TaxID=2613769 RepID=UPI0006FED99B|nr:MULTISPECIES: hypothetical protein [unclassified Rhizobium]KQV40013.1 hypothetical protein ASC86_22530 [Rhizobium sp. Root1212]KRD31723.1 hypothetical protein ASE37_23575 [Rhizobium sp. Root268]